MGMLKKIVSLVLLFIMLMPQTFTNGFAIESEVDFSNATEVSFGCSYSGKIEGNKNVQYYFNLPESGGIRIKMSAEMKWYSLFVYNANKQCIKRYGDGVALQKGDKTFDIFLEAGKYYFEVKKWDTATGAFYFFAEQIISGADISKPSSSISLAQPLSLNDVTNGVLAVTEECDFYVFNLIKSGTVEMTFTTQIKYYTIRLYNSKKEKIYAWGEGVAERAGEKKYNLHLECGQYYVEIYPWEEYRGLYGIKTEFIYSGAEKSQYSGDFSIAQNLGINGLTKGIAALDEKSDFYVFSIDKSGALDITLSTDIKYFTIKLYNEKKEKIYAWGEGVAQTAGVKKYTVNLKKGKYYFEFVPWEKYRGFYNINCIYSADNPLVLPIEIFDESIYIADIWANNRKDEISDTPENVLIEQMFNDKGEMSKHFYEELNKDKSFKTALKTWQGIDYIFDPATGWIKTQLEVENLYEILLGDMIHYIVSDAVYAENTENKVFETSKDIKKIMDSGFSAWQEEYAIKYYADLAKNKKDGGTEWKACFENVFEQFKKSGKYTGAIDGTIEFAGALLDIAKTMDDYCNLMAIYLEAMQLSDEMWAAIAKMKDEATSDNVKKVISELEYAALDKKLSKALLSAGLEATENIGVIVTDLMLEPVYNAIPVYREVRLAHKGLKTVYQLVFGTDDIVNAYYTLKATSELCDAAKAAALALEKEYLDTGNSEIAGNYIASIELMVSAINIDLDSLAKTMYIALRKTKIGRDYTAISPYLTYLGLQEEDIYEDFYDNYESLKESSNMIFRYLEVSWILSSMYLEKDYPELYSAFATDTVRACKDMKPKVLKTVFNDDGTVEIRLLRNMFIANLADGFSVKEKTGSTMQTYNFSADSVITDSKGIVLKCFDKNTVSQFPKKYMITSFVGDINDGNFSSVETTELKSPLCAPKVEVDNFSMLVGSSFFMGDAGIKIIDRTPSKYKDVKYHIYRSYDGGAFEEIAVVNRKVGVFNTCTEFLDEKIDRTGKHKTVTYKVKGEKIYTANGVFSVYSEVSEPISFTLHKSVFSTITMSDANQTLSSGNIKHGISVNWEKTDGAAGYEIYRKEAYAEDFQLIATVGNVQKYEDFMVSVGSEYEYYVLAYSKSGSSEDGSIVYIGGSKKATKTVEETILYGDVDGNGKVTAADARIALRASVSLDKLSDMQKLVADIDGNKSVTASDARKIIRASVGLEQLGTISGGNQTEEKTDNLEATTEDKEKLKEMIFYHTMDYNYETDDSLKVINYILEQGDQNEVLNNPVYIDSMNSADKDYVPDPKGLFEESYRMYDANGVKWICENIFHMNFDSSVSTKEMYIQNEIIYGATAVSGFRPATASIDSMTRLSDGKYEVILSFRFEGANELIGRKRITAELVELNGVRCWTFYYIENLSQQTEDDNDMPSTKEEICAFYADAVNYAYDENFAGKEKEWMNLGEIDLGNDTANKIATGIIGSFITSKEDAEEIQYAGFPVCCWELEDVSAVKSASCTKYGDDYKITILMNGEKSGDSENSNLYDVTYLYYSADDIEYLLDDDSIAKVLSGETDVYLDYKEVKIEAIISKDGKIVSVTHSSDVDIVIKSAKIAVYPIKDKRINVVTYEECYDIEYYN